MLTDIFAYRYSKIPIWHTFSEVEKGLLNQLFGVAREVIPYKENENKWKDIHDRLSRELGLDELFSRYYSYTSQNYLGKPVPVSGFFGWDYASEKFVKSEYTFGSNDPDRFIKERVSFIELLMRLRYEELETINAGLSRSLTKAKIRDKNSKFGADSIATRLQAFNQTLNNEYAHQVAEVNERFRRAKAPLTLHNGFIQISNDAVIEKNIAKPFWEVVSDPLWRNVDIDIKEALDRRDSNDKDPALFAAKALESAIKIVSDQKGLTLGNERGASNYIDNLVRKNNGRYIDTWEADILKDYFRKVRNTLGHGPGSDPMPELSIEQTDWAIESAMSWIRTLVRRL